MCSLGTPSEKVWPGYNQLPGAKSKFVDYPISHLRNKFPREMLSDKGIGLMRQFLTYDPKQRISCDKAKRHPYFDETPVAIDPSMFPTWPAKSELSASSKAALGKKASSPKPPSGGGAFKKINDDDIEARLGFSFNTRHNPPPAAGWNLRF
jgi:cell division cycle 2-like protein